PPSYVGDIGIGINPKLAARVREADLLLAVGPRLGEMTTSGYTLLAVPTPKQTLVHVHPGAEELSRVYQAALPILSGMEQFSDAVRELRVEPRCTVLCFAGDGDFLMTGQELATAVQYELPILVVVVNNGMYGTIRMHQERHYPGRVVGTDLRNPDFAAYARAFGAHGEVVERTEDFAGALERALDAGVPALLELRIDPEAITPQATLSEIR